MFKKIILDLEYEKNKKKFINQVNALEKRYGLTD